MTIGFLAHILLVSATLSFEANMYFLIVERLLAMLSTRYGIEINSINYLLLFVPKQSVFIHLL